MPIDGSIMSLYSYSSLDFTKRETRLLRLSPSPDFESELQVLLFSIDLDVIDRVPYQALSYVWGDPSRTVTIRINSTSVQATENLATALRYIRSKRKDIILWVDAVCINQEDELEKSYQVNNMAAIFSEAESVIAWVGEESSNLRLALQWIERFARWKRCVDKSQDETKGLFNIDTSAHEAILDFGRRPYWSRIWIVQELILARKLDVLCGNIHISMDDLIFASLAWSDFPVKLKPAYRYNMEQSLLWLELQASRMSLMVSTVYKLSDNYRTSTAPVELSFGFLGDFTHMHASDPRDKIFGLLDIVSRHRTQPFSITPDYTKTVLQVYSEAAKSLILGTRTLDCVIYAANQKCAQRINGLPSWVPDWRGGNENCVSLKLVTSQLAPLASEIVPAEPALFTRDGSALRVKGILIDTIKTVQANAWPFFGTDRVKFYNEIFLGNPVGNLTCLEAYFRLMSLEKAQRRDGAWERMSRGQESYWDAVTCFLKFLTGPIGEPQLAKDDMAFLIDTFFDKSLSEESKRTLFKRVGDLTLDHERYLAGCQFTAYNRIVFHTENGLMGLGRETIQPQDIVCFLFGSPFPVVLRKESDHFTFVGECFILNFVAPKLTEHDVSGLDVFEIQ